MNQIIIISLFTLIGIGIYIGLRLQLKWPSKNNALFFSIILLPSIIVALSPLAQTPVAYIVYSLASGLFLSDAFYHKHQQNKIYKIENEQRKKQRILEKEKAEAKSKRKKQ